MKKILFFAAFLVAAFTDAPPLRAASLNNTSTLIDQRDTTPQNITSTAPQFSRVIDDLPLMPGLETVPEEDVLFIAPSAGRIAATTAQGLVDIDDVYHFYRRTLPQLGWEIIDGRTYSRDSEILRIDAHANGKLSTVRFSVQPNP